MLRKKEVFTIITPIPGFIPRQLAIDILHSHSEVITLNPLVLDHKPIKAPRDAASDEFYSTWYEITERIQYIPGIGKMGSGKISFNGCFHDMPWGLQTHIYAPMNIDLRNKYRIAGNQPGVEPPEPSEIGLSELGVPSDGLYLREDIEIKCNVTMVGFVKSQLKQASKEMVQRIIKKAELLDAGVLQGMIEDGKLRTINPADRSHSGAAVAAAAAAARSNSLHGSRMSPQPSPTLSHYPPSIHGSGGGSPAIPYTVPRPQSVQYGLRPGSSNNAQFAGPQELGGGGMPPHTGPGGGGQTVIMELPGDYYHPPGASAATGSPRTSYTSTPPPSSGYGGDSKHLSGASYTSSAASRPSSLQSDHSAPPPTGLKSPPLDHRGFATELSTHSETAEEHGQHRDEALKRLDGGAPQQQKGYSYNPADYAKVSPHLPYGHQYSQQQQQQR